MNIRSVSNPAQVPGKENIESSKGIKSGETDEREGNGQQPYGDPEAHRPLTEEETEKVLEKLKSHEGIQKHGLIVNLFEEGGQKVVKIETPDGQVVKRINERDLYLYLSQENQDDVHLVNKTA